MGSDGLRLIQMDSKAVGCLLMISINDDDNDLMIIDRYAFYTSYR